MKQVSVCSLNLSLMKKIFFGALFFALGSGVHAQTDSIDLNLRVYGEVYYGHEMLTPSWSDQRLPFVYNHARNNQVAINLGLVQLNMDHEKYRARLGFHGGTYVQDNYSAEPEMLRYFSEANIGVSLSKKGKLWLDAGMFPSHIGFESAINTDNPTLSRSMIADLSPYYLCGAKLNWKPSEKIELEALVINGWQRIAPVQGNSLPSFGTRFTYTGGRSKFNWSTYVGPEGSDTYRRMRYFSNVYYIQDFGKRFKLILDVDAGIQESSTWSDSYDQWMGLAGIFRTELGRRSAFAFRGEWYTDPEDNITPFIILGADAAAGFSVNYDRKIAGGVLWRTEAKWITFIRDPENVLFSLREDSFFTCTSILFDLNRKMK